MVRLILGLMLFAALVLALAAVLVLARSLVAPPVPVHAPLRKEDPMPDLMRNIAYVLLVILLLGVATGWLGAAPAGAV